MSYWEPITRGEPEVLGIDPEARGLLSVRIPLKGDVSDAWSRHFEHPTGVSISLSMHPPRLRGATVMIRPPDSELAAYLAHVDKRIEAANNEFERSDLPLIRERERRDAEAREEVEQRIAAAIEVIGNP